ncbi:hypothetical protein HMPREF1430_00940 [Helicobacter pylori GAM96Ai]|uniref:hypothetical protein n=1 Tax=Helicobacter pylori TaxID=210 RepID=UPI0002BB8508|nr:hypothetical protein [Helicobacter pylori]EMH42501.1 hypothetical protein HMPREF1430_00940 [Helicobacter pylori GAM96Ai]
MQNDKKFKNKFKKNGLTFKKRYKFLLMKNQGKNYILLNEQKKPETENHAYFEKIEKCGFIKSVDSEKITLKLSTGELLEFVPYKNPPKIKPPKPTQRVKTEMDLIVFDKHHQTHPLSIRFNHSDETLILMLNKKAYQSRNDCQNTLFETLSQCPFEILIKECAIEIFLSKKDRNAFIKELGNVMWFHGKKEGFTDEEIKQQILEVKNSPLVFDELKMT